MTALDVPTARGVEPHSFMRVAPDYYDWSLEAAACGAGGALRLLPLQVHGEVRSWVLWGCSMPTESRKLTLPAQS